MTTIDSPVNTSPTNVDGVDFVLRYRFAGRRIPYFRVKLDPETAKKNDCEYSYVSIAKHGWRKAWKKALISLTVKDNRASVIRFLNRPPRESDFID